MITVGPYVRPLEPKPSIIVQQIDPCLGQELACTAAGMDLSKYIIPLYSTPGTANATGLTASGYNGGSVVYTFYLPGEIIYTANNWMEFVKQENKKLVESLNRLNEPADMNENFH